MPILSFNFNDTNKANAVKKAVKEEKDILNKKLTIGRISLADALYNLIIGPNNTKKKEIDIINLEKIINDIEQKINKNRNITELWDIIYEIEPDFAGKLPEAIETGRAYLLKIM